VCVAPDYVLIERAVYEPFLQELRKLFDSWWPKGALHPDNVWAKTPNERHFRRIKSLLDASKGKVVLGGDVDEKAFKIGPTVVIDVGPDDSLMRESVCAIFRLLFSLL
jgi:aldehyde dehydrogenase (NAD+)